MERERRTMPADVGRMLQDARLRAGLRLREAARVVGISHTHLFRLETSVRVPSRTVAGLLADALALTDAERARLLEFAVTDAGRDWPGRPAVSHLSHQCESTAIGRPETATARFSAVSDVPLGHRHSEPPSTP